MIQMFNVEKKYDNGVQALRGIDIQIPKGEFAFLVGPSGAGKTTLLRMVTREIEPTAGHVVVDGRNIERLPLSKIPYLRRGIGVVFQDYRLIRSRSVYDNVAFALRVIGTPRDEAHEKTARILDLLGLKHKSNLCVDELSGGEKQRVCIARALVNDPAILLTDEPTGNLDPELALDVMQIFVEVNNRGTTLLVATHNMPLVERFGRRVIRIVGGRVVSDDDIRPQLRPLYDTA